MSDDTDLNPGVGGDRIVTDSLGGVPERKVQAVKLMTGASGVEGPLVDAANPLPVAIPEPVSVDDNGASLTVDQDTAANLNAQVQGPVAHDSPSTGNPLILGGHATNTSPTAVATNDAVRVWVSTNGVVATRIADTGGNVAGITSSSLNVRVTGFDATASNLTKTEDAAAGSGDAGVAMLAVRRDTASSGVDADGDYATLNVDSAGRLRSRTVIETPNGDSCMDETSDALRVAIVSGAGSGGTSMTDDAAFTVGTTQVTPVAGTYRSSRDLVDDNDAGALAMTQRRALLTCLETPAGDSLVDDTNDAVKVGGSVAVDASLTNVQPLYLGTRASDAAPSPVSADGDLVPLRSDRLGHLGVRLYDAAGDSCMDDANNAIRVNLVAGSAAGGTSMTDDAAFTPGTTAVTPMAGTYRSARDTLDDNDAGAVALTQRRALYVALETPNGDSLVDDANDRVNVNVQNTVTGGIVGGGDTITADEDAVTVAMTDGRTTAGLLVTGTWVATLQFEGSIDDSTWFALPVRPASGGASVTSTAANGQWFADAAGCSSIRVRASDFTSGTATVQHIRHVSPRVSEGGGGGTEFAEDSAHSSGHSGTMALAVRRDTPSSGVDANGDYATLNVDSSGNLYTTVAGMIDEYVEDAATPANPEGPAVMLRRRDTPTTGEVTAEGDWVAANCSSTGAQYVEILAGATKLGNATGLTVQGAAATDAAVAGNPVYVGGRASAAEPTNVTADAEAAPVWVDRKGRMITAQQCGTASHTSVADSATSVTLLSANTSRKGATITNTSTAILYIRMEAAAASLTAHSAIVMPQGSWECPFGYTGEIRGIWATDPGTGNAVIGEFT